MKNSLYLAAAVFVTIFLHVPDLSAQGLLGRPQGYSREGKGLYTAVGFVETRKTMENNRRNSMKERIIYSEAGYGLSHGFELYGRLGFVDGVISGPLGPPNYHVSSTDLRADDRFLATVGLRWSHPVNSYLRMGVTVQGNYYINDASDEVIGIRPDGKNTLHEMKIKRQWSIKSALALQADLPKGVKIYAGPYLQYGEGKIWSLPAILGWREKININEPLGAYGGFTVPLIRRFSLTGEAWYGGKFSFGSMITYAY